MTDFLVCFMAALVLISLMEIKEELDVVARAQTAMCLRVATPEQCAEGR